MKVGINALLWTAAVTEEHFGLLDDIKTWGYDGVEFPMFDPECSPWQALAAKLDDLGMGRTSCVVVPEEANPISEDAGVRQAGGDHLKACIDSSVALGATHLVGPLYSPCGRLVGRGPTAQEWQWGIESMRAAGEYAQQAGVMLCLEPLNRFETYFLTCWADASRFVDEVACPNVRLMFDTFHANIEEKNPAAAIRATGKRIVHVHISENDRSTPGEGHIDWPATFAAVKDIGYDGWLTVEAFGRALPEIAAATSIWRDMLSSDEAGLAKKACEFIRGMW
jgi:D-psicose/D-tagatose/L-ribulose 3-epimerase